MEKKRSTPKSSLKKAKSPGKGTPKEKAASPRKGESSRGVVNFFS